MRPFVPPRRRLAFAWLLAAALLFAQTLGLAHQVLHAPGQATDTALFGHHAGADCPLYDQLAHGDALVAAPPLLPPALPAVVPAVAVHDGVAAAFAAAYRARGPPRA